MRRYLAEFIGTFGLVLAGTGAIVVNSVTDGAVTHLGIALTFGLIVMVMVSALGHISGCHINPAVTIAFTLCRHFPARRVPGYLTAQLLGAGAASLVVRFAIADEANLGATLPRGDALQSLVLEFILTFFLMFVIMAVATDTRAVGQMAALAIGATVGLEALFAGPISGASMNPARSLGPAAVALIWEHQWIYLAGPVAGAIAGAFTYQLVRKGDPAI